MFQKLPRFFFCIIFHSALSLSAQTISRQVSDEVEKGVEFANVTLHRVVDLVFVSA
ncbi:MAG: hypothetical protein U0X91_14250 [Spirosomataceae bacterium]